jgi:hypothetical protein
MFVSSAISTTTITFQHNHRLTAQNNSHVVKHLSPTSVIEADSLLETEVETLAEALESANNAVLSTISMISIMMSVSPKFLCVDFL